MRLFPSVTIASIVVGAAYATLQSPSFKPVQGAKQKMDMVCEFDVAERVAVLRAEISHEVKAADGQKVEIVSKYDKLEVTLDDQPVPIDATDLNVILDPETLAPTKATGGIDGSDPQQFLLVGHFMPPVGKELKPGEKFTVKRTAAGNEMPAFSFEGEYVGTETLSSTETHKFKGTTKMEGTEALSSEITAWYRKDGTLQKVDAKFKDMNLPVANAKASGSITLTRKD